MKFRVFVLAVVLAGFSAHAGVVGLPKERIIFPAKSGSYLVRVWDDAASNWVGDFEPLTGPRYYDFQYPAWGKMYWVCLWDTNTGLYVYGRWVGQTKTDDRKQPIP